MFCQLNEKNPNIPAFPDENKTKNFDPGMRCNRFRKLRFLLRNLKNELNKSHIKFIVNVFNCAFLVQVSREG